MNKNSLKIKSAIISVYNKHGIKKLAQELNKRGVVIYSTSGTKNYLKKASIKTFSIKKLTNFPEIMEGKIKTLHPKVHGGILGERNNDIKDISHHNIHWIDLIVCNLYPFFEIIQKENNIDKIIKNIDIGGSAMIRSAAKNFEWVSVLIDPKDYNLIISKLDSGVDFIQRKNFSIKAFSYTSKYDFTIFRYLSKKENINKNTYFSKKFIFKSNKIYDLRYGENPHQKASLYSNSNSCKELFIKNKIQGKPLSYNNIVDSSVAIKCLYEFKEAACVIVKHGSPCGVSISDNIDTAFQQAWEGDNISAFGGIVALNKPCTLKIAKFLIHNFIEILLAPRFKKSILLILSKKPNFQIIDLANYQYKKDSFFLQQVLDGFLLQETNQYNIINDDLFVPTILKPNKSQLKDIFFSWKVIKYIKSNAILIVENRKTLGIGMGQMSRIDAVKFAILKAKNKISISSILISDAFFPFPDAIKLISNAGIKIIVQPGGSIKDKININICNKYGLIMLFTGKRCFTH